MATRKFNYKERTDYFPKEVRKQYGLGEYAKSETKTAKKSTGKKATKK